MRHDILVIGGGGAGLSAALVLARACRDVVVVDDGRPRNAPSGHLHGYLSREGLDPAQLLATGQAEVRNVGGHIRHNRVTTLIKDGPEQFTACLDDGTTIEARAVLVATGLRDELPNIPGIKEHWGQTVVHCPYCHGYEVRDSPLGVLGGENRPFTMHQVSLVRQWSDDVVFFPHAITIDPAERHRLTARGIRIVEGRVSELADTDEGLDVTLADGQTVRRSTVFVGPRFIPANDLLRALDCAHDSSGFPTTNNNGQTSIPGVWAAGNVNDSPAQLIHAAAAGSRAAIAINHHLLALDIEHASTR
jgi:thioredoxin reductase (NADPH)